MIKCDSSIICEETSSLSDYETGSMGQWRRLQITLNYCAEFLFGNINLNLHFLSFLNIEMVQAVEIFPQVRQGPIYYWLNGLL